jgi:hypothetical protein
MRLARPAHRQDRIHFNIPCSNFTGHFWLHSLMTFLTTKYKTKKTRAIARTILLSISFPITLSDTRLSCTTTTSTIEEGEEEESSIRKLGENNKHNHQGRNFGSYWPSPRPSVSLVLILLAPRAVHTVPCQYPSFTTDGLYLNIILTRGASSHFTRQHR